jgi:hypothetical protein
MPTLSLVVLAKEVPVRPMRRGCVAILARCNPDKPSSSEVRITVDFRIWELPENEAYKRSAEEFLASGGVGRGWRGWRGASGVGRYKPTPLSRCYQHCSNPHPTTPSCLDSPLSSMQTTQNTTQNSSGTSPDLHIGDYRPMNNDPVRTSPGFRASIARSPGAYRPFSMYSPISHSVNEETSPLRWPP